MFCASCGRLNPCSCYIGAFHRKERQRILDRQNGLSEKEAPRDRLNSLRTFPLAPDGFQDGYNE